MKKVLLTTLALALGSTFATTALADDVTDILEGITGSVHGLDLLAINAAVNTANIDGSVNIVAGGSLQSAFPGMTFNLTELDDTLETFINKIDTVAIGAYVNGSTEIAAATQSIDVTTTVSDKESFDVSSTGGSTVTWCGINTTSGFGALGSDEFSLDKTVSLEESGLLGDSIAVNAAVNMGEIDASVTIGGQIETPVPDLAAMDITNVQISTQAIGAYTTGVINVGFSGLAVAAVE